MFSETIFTLPQILILSPVIITIPRRPGISCAFLSALEVSLSDLTTLPIAVAVASAKAVEDEMAITASALPRLKECPIIPEDVHIPSGVSLWLISKAIFPLKGDRPA